MYSIHMYTCPLVSLCTVHTNTYVHLSSGVTMYCTYKYVCTPVLQCQYVLYMQHVVVIPRRHFHLCGLVSMEGFNKEQQEGLIILQRSSFVW